MKTRRDFIKAGLALGAGFSLVDLGGLFAAETAPVVTGPAPSGGARPVLVAVRDSDRVTMVNKALETLGGISAFVRPGQTVLIKPNMGWDVPPERGANTHPSLIGHLVTLCREAGAKSVSVFDNTCDQWERCYANSGLAQAARAAGAEVVNGKDQTLYRETAIPRGVKLQSAKVHSLVLDSDVFINVPVLKHHGGALMTAAMKNLMGVIWDRRFYHRTGLHQCIADLLTVRSPTLNIIDAYHPMVRNGPRGRTADDLIELRTLLASTDIVAIDAAAAKLLGHQPADVTHVRLAAGMNLGRIDLGQVDVRRIKLA
jgi:uncharacterized protein (DUF362 family)